MHWLIMARKTGALGIGEPVGHFTGTASDLRSMDLFQALHARGLESVFPPLIPARYGAQYDSRVGGAMGGSNIGPPEPPRSVRWL